VFDYLNACIHQRLSFVGIIRKKPNPADAEISQYRDRQAEIPTVCLQSERMISGNRIEALILQGVGAELRCESDATPFLVFVNQQTAPFTGDGSHRELQLLAAVATERSQNVTCNALGVHPQERCARRRIA
jgi:hypothetical protein